MKSASRSPGRSASWTAVRSSPVAAARHSGGDARGHPRRPRAGKAGPPRSPPRPAEKPYPFRPSRPRGNASPRSCSTARAAGAASSRAATLPPRGEPQRRDQPGGLAPGRLVPVGSWRRPSLPPRRSQPPAPRLKEAPPLADGRTSGAAPLVGTRKSSSQYQAA